MMSRHHSIMAIAPQMYGIAARKPTVTTPKPNLAPGMQWLNGLYASTFNERHAQHGHVFGGRYKPVLVESDRELVSC